MPYYAELKIVSTPQFQFKHSILQHMNIQAIFETALHYAAQAHPIYRCHASMTGSHPLPDQLYGEHTGPHHILCGVLSITIAFSAATHTHTHSW